MLSRPSAVLVAWLLGWAHLAAAPAEALPPGTDGAIQPQVTMGQDGRIHIVYGQGSEIRYVTSADGRSFANPIVVGRLDKLALGMRRGPRIAVSPDKLVVTAQSHSEGNLYAWTSPDGLEWSAQPPLNEVPSSAREGLHALAADGRGRAAVVWLDLRTGKMSLWAKFSADGGRSWSEDRQVYASPDGPICQCCAPTVAFAPDGRIGILWRNLVQGARDLYAVETTDGRNFTPARKLGQGSWLLKACPMDGGALAYDPTGGWLPVWRRARSVFAGDKPELERKLADGATQPVATFVGTTPLILWEAGGSLMMQRGEAAALPYAAGGRFASIASHGPHAVVAYEGMSQGRRTIFCELLR